MNNIPFPSRRPTAGTVPALLAALAVLPWTPTVRAADPESLLLSNAIVHVVTGAPLPGGMVWIRDGKIQAVGTHVEASGATLVDLGGRHLYPGLISLDSALGLEEIESVRATLDTTEVGEFHPEVESWIAVNPDSELIPVTRANGITHAEPAPQGGTIAGLSGVVAFDGWTMEQMTIKKPAALHVYWPSMSLDVTPRERMRPPTPGGGRSSDEQARERVARVKAFDDFFQEARAYAKGRAAGKAGVNPPWEAMLPVVRGQIPIMVHADDTRQIKSAIKWAQTNDCKIIIVGGQDAWEVAPQLAERQVPVIYEGVFTVPGQEQRGYDVNFKAPEILRAAGVKVAFSVGASGMGASFARNLPYEAAQAVAFGLPESDALKGITLYPAQILGLGDRLGSIEAGKEASLFVADGNIFDIRSNVKKMWIAGREVDLASRHTRLFHKYKNRPLPQ